MEFLASLKHAVSVQHTLVAAAKIIVIIIISNTLKFKLVNNKPNIEMRKF